MLIYIAPSILLLGFFYMTYKNSPKYAWILLAIVAVSVILSFVKPLEKFRLIEVGLTIIAVFVIVILSRKAREKNVENWFVRKGFKKADVPYVKELFIDHLIGSNNYYAYENELYYQQKKIPYVLGINCHAYNSGKTPTLIFYCAYYFRDGVDVELLQQQFTAAKEATMHTNMFKSQLRYFDLKGCDIFKPAMGGIVARWKVPHSVEGYNDRFEWINKALAD